MLIMLLLFAIGSALCGAATNLNFLIAGRSECTSTPHYNFAYPPFSCAGFRGWRDQLPNSDYIV